MVIDCEFHFFMEEQVEQKAQAVSGKIVDRYWDSSGRLKRGPTRAAADAERYLRFMDEAGIDMAVVTTNFISGLAQMSRWNDYCAALVRRYPDRFIGFACIPPLGGTAALLELERAVKDLGLKGVHIWTQTDGRHLDSREMWPFYEEVNELGVPVDVHVTTAPPGYDGLQAAYGLYFALAREMDMCGAVMRLCLGGVLEEFPEIKFIMNHFGGGVTSMMGRVETCTGASWGATLSSFYSEKPLISKPWQEHFGKLYFNTAGRGPDMIGLKSLLAGVSPDKIVFGTDWPFIYDYCPGEVKRFVREIRGLDMPVGNTESILGGNALRLFGSPRGGMASGVQ